MRRRSTAQALAQRSRIVLECAEGHSVMELSRRMWIGELTLGGPADLIVTDENVAVERVLVNGEHYAA
ncbi:hypothetical protein [Streptomyces sp. NPDC088261]|uniref:hypothetical protein n=1 Tax=Streptomyces sp. NPDC088261 TaxID=3365851 RepID=UPI00380AB2C8